MVANEKKLDRLPWLDRLRGFALFGILLVNIQTFLSTTFYYGVEANGREASQLDQFAQYFLDLFVIGKFYPIFSLIFAFSFVLFLENVNEKVWRESIFKRRLVYLALFGFLHLLLIWRGDILLTYALAGWVLMLLRRRSLPFIRKFALSLFIIGHSVLALFSTLAQFVLSVDERIQHEQLVLASQAVTMYSQARYTELFFFRLQTELFETLVNSVLSVIVVLPLFLFAYYFSQKVSLWSLLTETAILKQIWRRSFIFSVSFSTLFIIGKKEMLPIDAILSYGMMEWIRPFAALSLAVFYMSSFLLLYRTWTEQNRSMFEAAGRMSLTNYLLQSFVCAIVFYGYGFGLYGKVGTALSFLLACIIYASLALFSYAWLKRFRYGPFEWLLRSLTMKKIASIRK